MGKLLYSFRYALNGWRRFAMEERNGQWQLFELILTITLGFVMKIGLMEWIAIIVCSGLVLALEMVNSVIEKLCNLVQPDWHPQVERIKDMAAGAVLIAAAVSVLVGLCIFLPKFIA